MSRSAEQGGRMLLKPMMIMQDVDDDDNYHDVDNIPNFSMMILMTMTMMNMDMMMKMMITMTILFRRLAGKRWRH